MICRRSLVSGRVQGVFYRATCVCKAQELGITGHARNLPDGRVEVLACGEAAAVTAFVAWLWEGSAAAKVSAVESADVDPASIQRTTVFTSA
jgi:acylphosphatase